VDGYSQGVAGVALVLLMQGRCPCAYAITDDAGLSDANKSAAGIIQLFNIIFLSIFFYL
jgi:hypothetical protein